MIQERHKHHFLKSISLFTICLMLTGLITITMGPFQTAVSDDAVSGRTVLADVGLTVNDIVVQPSPLGGNDYYPGQNMTISTTIWNYGNVDISGNSDYTHCDVLLTITDNDVYTFSTSQRITNLQRAGLSDSKVLNWGWTPLTEDEKSEIGCTWAYPFSYRLIVTTLLQGDMQQANNQAEQTLMVRAPAFDPEVKVFSGEQTKAGYIGKSIMYNMTVYNHGLSDQIEVVIVSLPYDWKVTSNTVWGPAYLDDEDNTTFPLIVTVSSQRQYALVNPPEPYKIRVRAISKNYPLATEDEVVTATVKFHPGSLIDAPFPQATVEPGITMYMGFNVTNIGNFRDSFRSRVEVPPPSITAGWRAVIYSGTITKVLDRGESDEVIVKLTVPAGLSKGAHTKVTFTTSSIEAAKPQYSVYLPDSAGDAENSVEIYAGTLYNAELEQDLAPIEAYPGQEVMVRFNLTNSGNGFDSTIKLDLDGLPKDWSAGFDMSEIPNKGLGRSVTAGIVLVTFIPPKALNGEYFFDIVVSAGKPTKEAGRTEVMIEVLPNYAVSAIPPYPSKFGDIGNTVDFAIFIQNLGNIEDVFVINSTSRWASFNQEEISLAYNKSYEVFMSVRVPLNATADTNVNTLGQEGYRIPFTVHSINDPENASTSGSIQVIVKKLYGFEFIRPKMQLQTSSDARYPITYTFYINNTGNIRDVIDIRIEDGPKWGTIDRGHAPINFHGSEVIKFVATPPVGTPLGNYNFTIRASSQGNSDFMLRFNLTVDVLRFDLAVENITIAGLSAEEAGNQDFFRSNRVLITADIVNKGRTPIYSTNDIFKGSIQVSIKDNRRILDEINISYILAGKTERVSTIWDIDTAGIHNIKVEVDPNNIIPESNEGSDNLASQKINVRGIGTIVEDDPDEKGFFAVNQWWLILIFILIISIAYLVVINVRTKVPELEDTGYTDKGEYKPFAQVYKAFDGEEGEDKFEFEKEDTPGDQIYPPAAAQAGLMAPTAPGQFPALTIGGGVYSGEADTSAFMLPEGQDPTLLLPAAELDEPTGMKTTKPLKTTKPMKSTQPLKTTKPMSTTKPLDSMKPLTTKPIDTTGSEETKALEITKPDTTKPPDTMKPVTTKPIEPATTKPLDTTKPVTTKPIEPVTTKPLDTTKPVTTKPVEPSTTQPVVPDRPATTTPVTTKPVTTSEPQDSDAPSSGTTKPVEPTNSKDRPDGKTLFEL